MKRRVCALFLNRGGKSANHRFDCPVPHQEICAGYALLAARVTGTSVAFEQGSLCAPCDALEKGVSQNVKPT